MIILIFQGPWSTMKEYPVVNDDILKSWRLGDVAPASASVHAMDVQTGELEDGTLLLSTWSFDGNKLRKIRKK